MCCLAAHTHNIGYKFIYVYIYTYLPLTLIQYGGYEGVVRVLFRIVEISLKEASRYLPKAFDMKKPEHLEQLARNPQPQTL